MAPFCDLHWALVPQGFGSQGDGGCTTFGSTISNCYKIKVLDRFFETFRKVEFLDKSQLKMNIKQNF
jgi:hypothetical protein